MKVWIDRCNIKCNGRLSWEGVATLLKESHRNQDTNLTQREIDLSYGLKYKDANTLFTRIMSVDKIVTSTNLPIGLWEKCYRAPMRKHEMCLKDTYL
jgi:hypothetical protein